jgi:hypothetical protein
VVGSTCSTTISVDVQLDTCGVIQEHVVLRMLFLTVAVITKEKFRARIAYPAFAFDFRDEAITTFIAFVDKVRIFEIG